MTTATASTPTIPRCVRTATIRLDLVAIPVKLYTSTEKAEEVHFNMLHDADGARLKQQYACTKCNEIVDREHTVKGYEFEKGKYVTLTSDELETLDLIATNEMTIKEFVPMAAVDPLYVEKTYYIGPDKGAERGYVLVADVMEKTGKVAIGTYARSGSEVVFMLRPLGGILAIHELRWGSEVKRYDGIAFDAGLSGAAELKLAKQIVERMTSPTFMPERYTDSVQTRVRQLIEAKIDGGQITVSPEAKQPMADLIEALRATLESTQANAQKKVTPVRDRKARAARAAAKTTTKRKAG